MARRILVVVLWGVCTVPAVAFSGRDHKELALEAAKRMPSPFKEFLAKHERLLLEKVCEPDFIEGDGSNHIYHPTGNGWGTNPDRVAELAEECVEAIRAGRPDVEVIQKLAYLAHYVTDGCHPLHASQSDGTETEYHEAFEKLWEDEPGEDFLRYEGRPRRVANFHDWQVENSRWALGHYRQIASDHGDDGEFDDPRTKDIYHEAMNHALAALVDAWTTVYVQATERRR